MITKETFIKAINTIEKYDKKEQKIYNATNGAIDFLNIPEIGDLVTILIQVLGECTNSPETDEYGNDIDYYIYQTNYGEKANEYYYTEQDGTEYHFNTPEDLWSYLNNDKI